MNSLYLLIPVTGVFLGIAIWAFIWAVNNDQFDDMDSAASSILFDDDDEQATVDVIKKRNHDI
jgi:cbb3-type cytochrome oxidase maturation protein